MMADRFLGKILCGFSWTMLSIGGALTLPLVLPFAVVFAFLIQLQTTEPTQAAWMLLRSDSLSTAGTLCPPGLLDPK